MEQIKKKMAVLRQSLLEAEERADKAEAELKEANERASNVSPFCVVGFVLYCALTSSLSVAFFPVVQFPRIAK